MTTEKIKMTPGIYKNIPFETYLTWDCFHKSMVPYILRSSAHLQAYIDSEKNPSKFMKLGSLFDCILTEPDMFPILFVEQPELYPNAKDGMKPWSNNANFCKDWNAEQAAQGKTIFNRPDYEKALRMVNSLGEHDTASKWLEGAEHQVSIVWQDEETGIMCKGRIDALKPDITLDVKTTVNASPTEFKKTVNNFMYHVQDVMYSAGLKALTGIDRPFGFVVVESVEPHCSAAYTLGAQSIEVGHSIFRRAINLYKTYLEKGAEGYSNEAQEIEIPQWAIYQEEEAAELDESLLGDTI